MPLVFSSIPLLRLWFNSFHFNCKTMPVASFAPQSPRCLCFSLLCQSQSVLRYRISDRFSANAYKVVHSPTLALHCHTLPLLHLAGLRYSSAILFTTVAISSPSIPCHSRLCLSFAKQSLRITSVATHYHATALLRYSIAVAFRDLARAGLSALFLC